MIQSCHPLTSDKRNKIIVKFSARKDAESVLENKSKKKSCNPRCIDIDRSKVFINESLCRPYKFLCSKGKTLWTESIEPFWASNSQIKFRIEPKGDVSRISYIQELKKLLPDYNFQSD